MAKEYFWGATLSKDKKIFKWDPESDFLDDEDDDEEDSISHFLFLKQAVLGVEAKDDDRNVIEVETINFDGDTVIQPLLSLRLGLNESTNLDIGLQPPVTFKLALGSGPVYLSGQHALDLQEDEEFGKDFEGAEAYEVGDEDLEDEDEGEEDEEEEETPKKGSPKRIVKKIAAVKGRMKGKGDELDEDEDEDDDEEEEEEEEIQTAKGKKRPAPSAKGPAKKMALGDDDDEDDDEEDDEDEEGMDDEDEEEEEEDSSPAKPAKKAKGKVNGTAKPKGTPKSQANKGSKEKKTYSLEDMKQDLIKSPSKPKKEEKFKNFVKSKFHLSEGKKIQELWGWYKSTQLTPK
ncbi:mitotic apparatus protein p62 isoform X3 [Strongylocentrotus purpuratus]|uniref:Nucleoplasmin core domain-containing protein n=1 Tax=Strongylocentrotus purpuratus TaxID=7668 RepID=A0A7M7NTN5_STRPU|nr:mitotic apparatus protein p62 isoform X3 [Strongylocentrotus purpuratus]